MNYFRKNSILAICLLLLPIIMVHCKKLENNEQLTSTPTNFMNTPMTEKCSALTSIPTINQSNIEISQENYVFITKWGSKGSGEGYFKHPIDITTDIRGDIYVTDCDLNIIQKFNSNGNFILQWGSKGSNNGEFCNPLDIATDSNGNIYVVDSGNYRIQKFTPDGGFITKWDYNTDSENTFPVLITIDANDDIYISSNNNLIHKYNSTGKLINYWQVTTDPWKTNLGSIYGIGIDSKNSLFVLFPVTNITVGPPQSTPNPASNYSFIWKFNLDGKLESNWPSDANCRLPFFIAITIDVKDNLFLANYSDQCIQKYSNNGILITKWGSKGSDNGQFNDLSDITTDSKGNIYVVDSGNYRIQKFAPNPNYNPQNPKKED